MDGLAVVTSFVLTPYTAFWQPEQPTYNPVEACFQLTHPQINGGEQPYYESPRFLVDGSMTVSCSKRQQQTCVRVGVVGLCEQRCACRIAARNISNLVTFLRNKVGWRHTTFSIFPRV